MEALAESPGSTFNQGHPGKAVAPWQAHPHQSQGPIQARKVMVEGRTSQEVHADIRSQECMGHVCHAQRLEKGPKMHRKDVQKHTGANVLGRDYA